MTEKASTAPCLFCGEPIKLEVRPGSISPEHSIEGTGIRCPYSSMTIMELVMLNMQIISAKERKK